MVLKTCSAQSFIPLHDSWAIIKIKRNIFYKNMNQISKYTTLAVYTVLM